MKKVLCLMLLLTLVACGGGKKPPENLAQAQQDDPNYNYRLGVLQLNQGNVPSAILALQKCVAVSPNNAEAWNALGLAHFMGRQYKDATTAFGKALELNPSFTDVHNNLGNVFNEMAIYDKAKAEYNKVLEDLTYPKPEAAYFNLALIAYVEKDSPTALKYCRLAVSMNPGFSRVYNMMGRISEDQNDMPGAISNYRVGLIVDPDGLELNFSLAVALYKVKKYDEARERFEKVLLIGPTSSQARQALAYMQTMKEGRP